MKNKRIEVVTMGLVYLVVAFAGSSWAGVGFGDGESMGAKDTLEAANKAKDAPRIIQAGVKGQALTVDDIVVFHINTTGRYDDATKIAGSLGELAGRISVDTWLKIIDTGNRSNGASQYQKQRVLELIPASVWIDKLTAQDVAKLLGGLRNYMLTFESSPYETAIHLEEAALQTIPRAAYAKYTPSDVAVITSALSSECFHSICPKDVFKNLLARELEKKVPLHTQRETEELRSSYMAYQAEEARRPIKIGPYGAGGF